MLSLLIYTRGEFRSTFCKKALEQPPLYIERLASRQFHGEAFLF